MSNLGLPGGKKRTERHASQQTASWLGADAARTGKRYAATNSGVAGTRKKRKFRVPLIIGAVLVAAAAFGPGGNTTSEPQQATDKSRIIAATEAMAPSLADVELHVTTDVLEYSTKTTDPLGLVSAEGADGIEITTDDALDLQSLGEQTIHYVVTLGSEQGDFDATFTVRDTQAPTIRLSSSTQTITQGESFNPLDAIAEVSDPVEGELPHADAIPDELEGDAAGLVYEHGWYLVAGDYDTSAPGTYYLTVEAHDNHGNTTHKELTLVVEAMPEPEPDPEAVAAPVAQSNPQERTYILNTNTHKFHLPGCRAVNQMADHNKAEFTGTRDEVIAKGYDACGICHP